MTKEEMKEILSGIEEMKMDRDKKKTWLNVLFASATVLTMLTVLSGMVMAFTVVREGVQVPNRTLLKPSKPPIKRGN